MASSIKRVSGMTVKCVKRVYEKPMHDAGDDGGYDTASLIIDIENAGAGDYVVMHATHWDFNGKADIDQLRDLLLAALGECDDGLLAELNKGAAV
jgi:hypothetical protein